MAAWREAQLALAREQHVPGSCSCRRERRLLALVVITDVYAWKLLRRDMGLGPAEIAATLLEMTAP